MKYYLSDSKKILITNKKNNKFNLEFIDNASIRLSHIKDLVINDLYNITKDAGQNPEIYINKWFEYADALIIARDNNDHEIAYTIVNYYNVDVLFFVSSMIRHKFQNQKLGKFMNFHMLKYFTYWRIEQNIKNAIFPSFYYIFRTQNPILYYTWYKYTNMYPKINDEDTPLKEINIAKKFSKIFWPNLDFDNKKFVLKGAYKKYPGLKIKKEKIQWCKDERINNLFKSNLDIDNDLNDALLILGKISRVTQLFVLLFKKNI